MAAVQSIAKKPDIRRRQPSVTTAAVLVFFASLIVLFAAFVIGTSATSYIPPGEDGETCADTLCEDGMVCVQGQTGANCMAKDPASNCELLDCASGRKCIYEEEECIPDKACFARPVCSTGGPQPSPIEQAAEMIGSNGGQSLPSEAPPGGPVGGSSVARQLPTPSYGTPQPPSSTGPKVCNLLCMRGLRCVVDAEGPKCVPVSTATSTSTPLACGANEKVRACGALCEGKCENVGKGPIACLFICLPPACSCKDGFYRDGSGLCVTATLCQRDSPGGGQPPCLAKCSTNQHCVLSSDDSSCYNPPCPPVPTCVQNQPLRGPPNPCAVILCAFPSRCVVHNGEGMCERILCEKFCPFGERCELMQVQCKKLPCPPVEQCVPAENAYDTGSYASKQCILPCPLGQKCITKQVQCVRAPCPPIQSCVAVTASDGNNKDTVPSLTCANALCALETPRCVESPNGPKCVAVKKCSETLCPEGELCEQPVPTQDAKCVPDKSACGANEKVRACGALCEGKCENVGKGPIACPTICLPPACSCKDGFYRDGSARCVTAALCQREIQPKVNSPGSQIDESELRCDENEQVDGCGNRCEPTCENAYGKLKVCVLICDPPACTCKLNYFRRDGKCIPQNECPPPKDSNDYSDEQFNPSWATESSNNASFVDNQNPQCGSNETLSGCGNLCEGKCENLGKGPIACPAVCAPAACACSDGYYRNENGKCVGSIDCSSNCKEHEQMNPCGSRCESTCDHAFGKPKFCVKICDPPACVCKLNYYRKGRECVPHAACGTNPYSAGATTEPVTNEPETGGPDPNLCHQFYCPKGQECSLESGEAKCVANNDPRCSQNETFSACGNVCEGKCSTAGSFPRPCPLICAPASCSCKEGFYRNAMGVCVNRSDCSIQCSESEVLNPCGRQCDDNCATAGMGPLKCNRLCGQPECVCREGFYRNSLGKCVLQRLCSAACPQNEHGSTCGDLCELSCDGQWNKERELPCIEICAPAACVCDDGYVRLKKGGHCVPERTCPSGRSTRSSRESMRRQRFRN